MASKRVTLQQAEAKRLKAVEFLRRMGRDEDADAFEAMDTGEYIDHRGLELIANPRGRFASVRGSQHTNTPKEIHTMATKSRAELERELEELQAENEDLNDRLDSILSIVDVEDDDGEDDDYEDGD